MAKNTVFKYVDYLFFLNALIKSFFSLFLTEPIGTVKCLLLKQAFFLNTRKCFDSLSLWIMRSTLGFPYNLYFSDVMKSVSFFLMSNFVSLSKIILFVIFFYILMNIIKYIFYSALVMCFEFIKALDYGFCIYEDSPVMSYFSVREIWVIKN